MADLVQDLRHAVRRLTRTPGFTSLALATLALGIGANAALFSVVDAVLLKPLPFSQPERVYAIWSRHTSTDRYPFSLPEFCDYRDRNRSLEAVAGLAGWSGNLGGEETTERLPGMRVSGNLFEMLGVSAAVGRTLRPSDDDAGGEKVIVLSHGLWERRFGSEPGVVGRPVTVNGEAYTVVGVLPRDFMFPVPDIDLAIPLAPELDPLRHNRESTNFLRILARAREGSSPAAVAEDLEDIGRRLQQEFPGTYARKKGVLVTPYREELTRNFSRTLVMLMAAVALLLLVACANLANLMLVRATARRQEIATRVALGARPSRVARELLVEAAMLSFAGAFLGVLLAWWSVPALVALSPTAMPRSQGISLNLTVLGFTAVVALLAGLAFGLVPAWRALGAAPNRDLQSSRGGAGTADGSRARGVIVAAQVAVMVVLLSGASLLYRSFHAVMRIEPGFNTSALTVRLSLPLKDYPDNVRISRFYEQLEARLLELPGVESVAAHESRSSQRRDRERGLQGGRPAAGLRGPAPDRALPDGDSALLPHHGDPGRGRAGVRRERPRRPAGRWHREPVLRAAELPGPRSRGRSAPREGYPRRVPVDRDRGCGGRRPSREPRDRSRAAPLRALSPGEPEPARLARPDPVRSGASGRRRPPRSRRGRAARRERLGPERGLGRSAPGRLVPGGLGGRPTLQSRFDRGVRPHRPGHGCGRESTESSPTPSRSGRAKRACGSRSALERPTSFRS